MVPDCETDVVYFSELLGERYGGVLARVRDILVARGVVVKLLSGTRDIWARDFMPIQLDRGRFIQFRYEPWYLRDDPDHRTGPEVIERVPGIREVKRCDLNVDGGNIVRWRDRAIMTERVFDENRADRTTVRRGLAEALEVEDIIFIPPEGGKLEDMCGHADGIVRFVDRDTVLLNDYAFDEDYGRRVRDRLRRARIEAIPFPYKPTDEVNDDGVSSAKGVWINFLQTAKAIIVPGFGSPDDEEAAGILERTFPGVNVSIVSCVGLCGEGGNLNCVSWNVGERKNE